MTLDHTMEGRELTVRLTGELDHHRAKEIMAELNRQIDIVLPKKLILDLKELSFTDSSGIAVLLRTSRRMSQIQGEFQVVRTPKQAEKVFFAAGLDRMIRFE